MRPPRLARWILARTLHIDDRNDVLANLDELYRRRLNTRGTLASQIWYWIQATTFALRLRWSEDRHVSRSKPRQGELVSQFTEDVRFAARSFRKSPAFTLTATLTLALGVGVNALIFSVVYEAVLRPLPFPEAEELVWLWPNDDLPLALDQFSELQREAASLAQLSAVAGRGFAITGGDLPDEISGFAVSTNHFTVFGSSLLYGRAFSDEDALPGAEPVAVLSHEVWQSHFGADSAIVGRRVDLYTAAAIPMIPGAFTGTPHTVIGVTTPAYRPFGSQADVYTPLVIDANDPNYSRVNELGVVGRLRPGVEPEQLQVGLAQLATRLPTLQRSRDDFATGSVHDLGEILGGNIRMAMLVTLGAVGLVLLIACANVANLVLVRTQARQHELSLRHALGASRGRVARQLFTESLVLSGVATIAGTGLAAVLMPIASSLIPPHLTNVAVTSVGTPVLVFSIIMLLVTTTFCGLVPTLQYSRARALTVARTSRNRGMTKSSHIVNRSLAALEIALALALAYGAGLLLISFVNLRATDVGFDASNVMTLRVAPSDQQYRDVEVRRSLIDRVLSQIQQVPGVSEAGAIHFLPIADGGPSIYFLADASDPESRQAGSYRVVTPGYLEVMRIPLLAGRRIGIEDQSGTAPVGMINRAMSELLWPGEDAVGRTVYRSNGRVFFTIVGVVGDIRQAAVEMPPYPELYIPLTQTGWASSMTIVARVDDLQSHFGAELRGIVQAADGNLPITRVAWMEDIVRDSVANPRFYTQLFSVFALLAIVLGGVGVYGVSSYIAGQRAGDIGIQLALGASRWRILSGELKGSALVAITGIGLGILATLGLSRLLGSLLFEVSVTDPAMLLVTSALLGGTALAGAFLPAKRAASGNPLTALRDG